MANVPIVTEILYADLVTLIAANGLKEGLQYNITDRDIRLTAISNNQFNPDGLRKMLCPAFYGIDEDEYSNNWIGVWNPTLTPTANDLTIWGGLVWKNLTGEVGTKVDDFGLDLTNWQAIPKATFANHEYVSMIFYVNYDVENDWINKQRDNSNNILGLSKKDYLYNHYVEGEPINMIDICDWNFSSSGYPFHNNNCWYIYNNSNQAEICNNNVYGSIYGNYNSAEITNNNSGNIENNHNDGGISKNICDGISSNFNSGNITGNSNKGLISANSNMGAIQYNCNLESITDNSNNGSISYNCNNGVIHANSHSGNIFQNSNTGFISHNSTVEGHSSDIKFNINNGNITGVWDANVIDTVVTKNGTAT